jgi:hypothetical protein
MIDYTAEKLIHALQMLVPLRARLWSELSDKDKNTLTYSIEDLAKGAMDYCLRRAAKTDHDAHNQRLRSFVGAVQNAKSREDVVSAFVRIAETQLYWDTPYFDSRDLTVLREARKKLEVDAEQTAAADGLPPAAEQ